MNERSLVLVAIVVFFFLGLVLPLARLWLRSRVFGVVLRRSLAAGLTFGLLAMLAWGVAVAFVEPARLGIWPAPVWLRATGWALICGGVGLLIAAQAQLGSSWRIGIDQRPTELVTRGLYSAIRNPIYSAMSLMILGLCAVTPSAFTLAGWLVTAAVAQLQARREERHLLAIHGERYRAYASKVGRFVPGVGRLC